MNDETVVDYAHQSFADLPRSVGWYKKMSLYDKIHELPSGEKHLIDLVSLSAMLGAMTEHLPTVAAGFTIVWTTIRIWETETVQGFLNRQKPPET